MAFTDSDFQRWRGLRFWTLFENKVVIRPSEAEALLARLEAAERALSHGNIEGCNWCDQAGNDPDCSCGKSGEDYEAWRKAAGK